MRRLCHPPCPRPVGMTSALTLWHRVNGTSPRQHHKRPVVNDPATWPTDWKEQDIREFLFKRVKRGAGPPNYASLATLFALGDHDTLKLLLSNTFMSPPLAVDIEAYLGCHVNNTKELAAKPLFERDAHLDAVESALASRPDCQKPKIAYSCSPRGRGKTQFVKFFVHKKRAEATKCGRVIVRCCDVAGHEKKDEISLPWMQLVLRKRAAEGVRELIRSHVEDVTGSLQDASDYSDVPTACKTWMSVTADFFGIAEDCQNVEPLIILDTCDLLTSPVANDAPYSLLEAFCQEVPSSCSIFVIGCDAQINALLPAFETTSIVTNIGPLPPLTEQGSLEVAKHCPRISDDHAKLFHHWTGGVSRLLTILLSEAQQSTPEKLNVKEIFNNCVATAKTQYPLGEWFPQAYTCLLASSTKAEVKIDSVIGVNTLWRSAKRRTYTEAAFDSIGSFISLSRRFQVPPIVFAGERMCDMPILPEELLPFLSTENFEREVPVNELVKSLLFCVYARYLLVQWEGNSKNPWVSLAKVFDSAVNPKQVGVLERYEVNLALGVKHVNREVAVRNAVTYRAGNPVHDACIWCRDKTKKTRAFAVPLQLPPSKADAHRLLGPKVPLVLSVDFESRCIIEQHLNSVVMINANEMSCTGWMWKTN